MKLRYVFFALFGVGVILYIMNFQVYACVGNYLPVMGFTQFVNHLDNLEWLEENYATWSATFSPVLLHLNAFLTNTEVELNVPLLMVSYIGIIVGEVSLLFGILCIQITKIKRRYKK